jgi:hypothetical protein
MHRRSSLAILALASSAALVAGCGGSSSGGTSGTNDSSQSPSAELSSAVSALGDASTLTSTLKLGATASDLQGLAASSGSSLTSAQANALAGAQIAAVVSAPSGKTISDLQSDTTGASADITLSNNGTNWVSLRVVDKTLYVQANLKDLLNALGKGATYAQLQASSAQLPTFFQSLIAGKWISLPSSAAASLTGGAAPSSSPNPSQFLAFVDALKSLLTQDMTVARTSTGSTDEFALTANSKTLVQDFISKVEAALPAASSALAQATPGHVPSRSIQLNAQVTNGALSQLSIDLGQFDQQHKRHLPVVLEFSQGGSAVGAPSGAVAVNTQELQLLSSLSGGISGG